jgi:hypothetical protein
MPITRVPAHTPPLLAALSAALALISSAPLCAQEPAAQSKLVFDVDLAMANVSDQSLNQSLGRERQTKIPYAILAASGTLSPHLSYRLELNGVNDSVKPEPFLPTSHTPFFFPNRADPSYGVSSKPEGQFKVDDYKNTGLDPFIQEQNLRRAFIDAHTASGRLGVVAGRFFVPVGFELEEGRWFTAKDLTHIQAINAQTDVGAELYYKFGADQGFHGRVSGAVITGNGNPYHDYVYFDFTRSQAEDTNSGVGGVGCLRLSPVKGLELRASGEYNFVGSRVAFDTTVQRSKHYDHKLVVGARYRPSRFKALELFGEYAHYQWGLRDTSAAQLPGPPTQSPIQKNGYYAGGDLSLSLPRSLGKAGVVFIREELDRDDALIAFLAAREQLEVSLGKTERRSIVKLYATLGALTVFFFYNDIQNPFPQASAIVPISGPSAFVKGSDSKLGVGFRLRASFKD